MEFHRSASPQYHTMAGLTSQLLESNYLNALTGPSNQLSEFIASQSQSSQPGSPESEILVNPEILFRNGLNLETADRDLLNKYVPYTFGQYAATNTEDYDLWDAIQVDYEDWEEEHFNQLSGSTWKFLSHYCYTHGYWIDHNFGNGRTRATNMLKAIQSEWNNKWTLDQIKWVEDRFSTMSRITRKRQLELTAPTTSNVVSETTIAHSQGQSIQGQSIQDATFQTPASSYASINQYAPINQWNHVSPSTSHLYQPSQQAPQAPFNQAPQAPFAQAPHTFQSPPHTTPSVSARSGDSYSSQLVILDEIYKEEDKFSDTGDNFDFKILIFQDKCRRAGLPEHAYIQGASIMLSGRALSHYYANQIEFGYSFDHFCTSMRSFFEGPEWQRCNLNKWQTINIGAIIAANPTLSMSQCLDKLCTELNTTQRGLDAAYQDPIHMRENIIRACRGHPALIHGLTNPPMNYPGLISNLYTSIINYEAVRKQYCQGGSSYDKFPSRPFRKKV